MQKKRGERFGEVAKNYQRYRKSHPREIFANFFSLLTREGAATAILDLACGSGKSTEPIARRRTWVVGCDPDFQMLKKTVRRTRVKQLPITYVCGRAEKLPFQDNAFNAVVIGSAFHWFASKQTVVEIKRVLKPGGLVYIFGYRYPTTEREDEYNEEAPLLRKYSIEYPARERLLEISGSVRRLLDACGFENIDVISIQKLRRYAIAERVGRIKTLSAYTLLSSTNKRRVIVELTRILKKKWGSKKYLLIPQTTNICYGYKPKQKAAK